MQGEVRTGIVMKSYIELGSSTALNIGDKHCDLKRG